MVEIDERIARVNAEDIEKTSALAPKNPRASHETPEMPEGEPKTTVLLWSMGIILALIAAIFIVKMVIPPKGPETLSYNGFDFQEVGGLWMTKWQRGVDVFEVTLHFNPLETENISIGGVLNATASRQPIYITFDPTGEDLQYVALAAAELSLNYARGLNRSITAACTVNETDACAERPIVSCDDGDKAVIFLNQTTEPSIELRGNCIELSGKGFELTRAVDRLLYHFFRIQP